jgi:ATP-dependent protease ClpP protease subunit
MKISDVINLQTNGKTATIEINGVIGIPEWYQFDNADEVVSTKEKMKKELKAIEGLDKKITNIYINIDSPGGSVDHAMSIYNALINHPARVHAKYTGNSASAATIIAAAAQRDDISIPEFLTILIHEARIFTSETMTASELEEVAGQIRKLNTQLAKIYSNLNGKSIEENLAIMAENNGEGMLLTADEAMYYGFVGKIISINKRTAKSMNYSRLVAFGYSENQIEKLKSVQTKNQSKMSLFEKLFSSKATENVYFAENDSDKIIYTGAHENDIKIGNEVKAVGSGEAISGNFEVNDVKFTVIENKITTVERTNEDAKAFDAMKKELNATKAEFHAYKSEIEAVVTELKAMIDANTKALETAKITVPKVDLPKAEFSEIEIVAKNPTRETQKKVDERAREKQAFRMKQINGEV